jgi:hypothetical protein
VKKETSWQTPEAQNSTGYQNQKNGTVIERLGTQVLSWPTARTSDAEEGRIQTEMTETGFRSIRAKSNQYFGAKLRDAVETYTEKNWPTPAARDCKEANGPEHMKKAQSRMGQLPNAVIYGPHDPGSLNTHGKNQEQ